MTHKLIAIGKIKSSLAAAVEMKRNTTISALFHGVVCGNVAFATEMTREDMADFDTVLRQLLPIGWNKANGKYTYDLARAVATGTKLGINLNALRELYKAGNAEQKQACVDEFFEEALRYYGMNATKKKAEDLTADQKRESAMNRIKNSVKAAKEQGATDTQILNMLAELGVKVTDHKPVLSQAA